MFDVSRRRWLHRDQLDRYAATDLEAYAVRVAREDTPELEVEDPQECIDAIEAAYDDFDEAARRKLREAVLERLREDFPLRFATNRAGEQISLEDLADYVMDPKKDALWLGNEDYEDLVNEARARCLIFSRVFNLRWESSPQAYWTCPRTTIALFSSAESYRELAPFFPPRRRARVSRAAAIAAATGASSSTSRPSSRRGPSSTSG